MFTLHPVIVLMTYLHKDSGVDSIVFLGMCLYGALYVCKFTVVGLFLSLKLSDTQSNQGILY